jgi:hypothetical protein
MNVFGVAVRLGVAVGVLMGPSAGHADEPCSALNYTTGCATASAKDFRGAIIVPGSDLANEAVARSRGCAGCVWTLVLNCDLNTVEAPSQVNCGATRCPDGMLFRLFLERPGDPGPAYLDTICITRTRRIVTAAEVAVDAERYLTALRPPATRIAMQPEGRAVTRLPTFFRANGPGDDRTTLNVLTPAGPARLDVRIAPSRYAWTFGDGATCATTTPGGQYDGTPPAERCDDRVAHLYGSTGRMAVRLRTTWAGTYTFDVGFGPVGPLQVPGNGVDAPDVTRALDVREARAELVGG